MPYQNPGGNGAMPAAPLNQPPLQSGLTVADLNGLRSRFAPVLEDIAQRSAVTGRLVHRDAYRIYVATLWTKVVLQPSDVGVAEEELEALHDILNEELQQVLGADADLTSCFAFLNSKQGEAAMQEARLTSAHKDLLRYFCSMILDPEGHRKWAQRLREKQAGPSP